MVLPKHNNTRYIDYKIGDTFGVVDIIGSTLTQEEMELDEWFLRKDLLKRQFTVMASTYTELMSLSVQDLYRVQLEFQEYYDDLFEMMKEFLHRIMVVKIGTIDRCTKAGNEHDANPFEEQNN